jgi:hypothetical protein
MRNRRQVVVRKVLETHRADHHELPCALVSIGLLGPIRSTTSNPIDAIRKQFTKLGDAEILRCFIRIEVAYERYLDQRFDQSWPSARITDFYDVADELLHIKELWTRGSSWNVCHNIGGYGMSSARERKI